MAIIGISGHKQSGKDTIAKIWQLLDFAESQKYREVVGEKYPNKETFVLACLTGEENYTPYQHYFLWEIKSFAHKLKEIVSVLTGICVECLDHESTKQSTLPNMWLNYPLEVKTYRELLQKLGTEVFRNHVAQTIWIDLLVSEYKTRLESSKELNWLITDVRFPDEADAIKSMGGELIRVITPYMDSGDTHTSETGLDSYAGFDHVFFNERSGLEKLIENVEYIKEI